VVAIKKYMRGHIGEKYKTTEGYQLEIIDGGSKNKYCTIKIENENGTFIRESHIKEIKNGRIKNPYHRSVYGIGYFGVGDYKSKDKNKNRTLFYKTWTSMIRRCYSDKIKLNNYDNTKVCDGWHNYQVFAKWCDDNYDDYGEDDIALDKDLLGDGDLYSPDTCIFIPRKLNNFLGKCKKTNKSGYTGVSKHTDGKFQANVRDVKTGKVKYLGLFYDKEDAYRAILKEHKVQINKMKSICRERWKIKNPKVYEALNNFKLDN